MRQLVRSPRLVLSFVCVLLAGAGAMVAAERSSSAMADAATAFVASLTPEQRQKAVFAFESVGLARGGAPRVAALQRGQRHIGGELTVVLRIEPGRSARRAA